jgi:hypothetical protein
MNVIRKFMRVTLDLSQKLGIIVDMDTLQTPPSLDSLPHFLRKNRWLFLLCAGVLTFFFSYHPISPLAPLAGLVVSAAFFGLIWFHGSQRKGSLAAFLSRWINGMEHGAACLYCPPEKPRSLRWLTIAAALQVPSNVLRIAFSQPKNAQAPNIFAA